ncbi:sialic acid-binding Ig-like lectin 14 [Danio rerio]|uniref:Sialic acid-binding Ig-like lectin 14 n=2 Tax=Danio rerio TaxID=7955 RepID=A0AC58J9Y2_DANRE|nr:myelin-associated glycoprotein-like [Danio rerio]|eukprot:XP_017210802.1 myelin-associated glycoprotein-like [Danio rerio]
MGLAEKISIFVFLLQGVYCRDYDIFLPEKIEALSGSCVIIECRFEIVPEMDKYLTEENAVGFWFNGKKEVFHSKHHKADHFEGTMSEKLHEKNCTTVFYNVGSDHNNKFYFRIESTVNGIGLKYSYNKKLSTINVVESPVNPRIVLYEDEQELQDQQEVLEGRSVSLRCSAETLCSIPPATLTWSSAGKILLSESSKLQELVVSALNFTAAPRHHRVTFTCSISYQLQDNNKTARSSIPLHVQYSPKNTSVSVFPSNSVLVGHSVTLTCSSEANPAVLIYSWSRETKGQLEMLQTGETLTFNETALSHSGLYICTAQNKHGTQTKAVMLDIQYVPQISSSSSCTSTGVTECFCEVDGNPYPEVEWHLSGHLVSNSPNTFISEKRLSNTSLRSVISLQSLTHNSLLCVSKNAHGNASQLFYLVFITENEWFNIYSLMIGVLAGTLFVVILWASILLCKRNRTQRTDKTILIRTDVADSVNNGEESFYANKVMMSSAEAPTQNHRDHLQYSTINFINNRPESNLVRGISSLTTEYAAIQYCSQNVAVSEATSGEVPSVLPNEDPVYQVPNKAADRTKRK